MKAAKTARNRQRDWALTKAEELLTKNQPGEKVEVKRGNERVVKVNNAVAFKQEQEDAKGSFVAAYSHLSLP